MKKLLLSLVLLLSWFPANAEAAATRISCDASVVMPDRSRVFYTVSGSVDSMKGSSLTSLENPDLVVTIRRRERNGRERVVRSNERLGYFETDAPDANYSQIPFSGSFKAQPNDGSGIYHVRSAKHGVYLRLLPTNKTPTQMQVVHFTDRFKYARSQAAPCALQ